MKDAEQFGLPPPDPTPAQTARILIASGDLENYLLSGGRRVRASIRRYSDQCRIAGTNFSRTPEQSSAAAASDAP